MIYYFPPEFGLFMLVVIVGWLIVAGFRSLNSRSYPKLDPVSLDNTVSPSGKCRVDKSGYYADMGKYIAEVVCPELDSRWTVVADCKEELEEKVKKEFCSLEERIRDKINKRAMKRPVYFHIK